MNLAKIIVADISVCLKVRVTQVWLDRGTLLIIISLGWHGHVNAASPLVYWKLLNSEVAQTIAVWRWCWIMFQKENNIWNIRRGVEVALQQVASKVRAVRHGQGSDPCLGAMWALPVVPWKWSELFVHLLMDDLEKMKEVSSPNCF